MNWTKIKGGYQSGKKVVAHNSKSDLPLVSMDNIFFKKSHFDVPTIDKMIPAIIKTINMAQSAPVK